MTKNQRRILYLSIITLLYFLPGITAQRDFWVEDEARYCEVLREMIHEGNWIVPYLNGTFYPDKPPVYFWLCALVSMIVGKITLLNCMIITWLSTLGCVIGIYAFAKKLFDDRVGFFSGLIFISMLLTLICGQIVRMDMLMTCFIIFALYYFYRGFTGEKPTKNFMLFYVFSALAVLSKGPLGFIFPFVPAVGILIQTKQWRMLRQLIFSWGFLLFFFLVGSWFAVAWFMGEQAFIRTVFTEQIAGRAVNSFIHKEPFYFYLMLLPLVMIPWIGFLPRALNITGHIDPVKLKFLLWWFIGGFMIISAISGKLFIYLLPLMPPLVIILAVFFAKQFESYSTGLRIENTIALVLSCGLFAILPFVVPDEPMLEGLNLVGLSFIFVPTFILGIIFIYSNRIKEVFILLFTGMWMLSAYLFFVVAPQIDHELSARKIGQEIAEYKRSGYGVATFNVRRGIFNFYANQRIPSITKNELKNYHQQPQNILIVKEDELKKQGHVFNEYAKVVSRHRIAHEDYVVVTTILME